MPGNDDSRRSSFWRDRSVLITGATGLLGGWVVRRLIDLDADAVCLVRDWVPRSEVSATGLLDRVRVVRGDVRDQELLERILGEYEVTTVLHLAAQTTVGVANGNPASTLDTNIRGTWSVLEACRRVPVVEHIVVASSDKAYGDQDTLPYTEATPLRGLHPYDASKACADLLSQMFAKSYGLPVCVTRCGNFYGGGDLNWNRLVPGTIRSVLRGERPVVRSDGNYTRDYVYVEDGARAYLQIAEALAADRKLAGEAFNFSCDERLTVIELVSRLLRTMGSSLEPDVRNEATNEIRDQYLDASRAKSLLGWGPEVSLDEGLRRTVRWYTEYFSRG
jgi:CDP-glucose 4,6-dehydratase